MMTGQVTKHVLADPSQVRAVQDAYIGRFGQPFEFGGETWVTLWIAYSTRDGERDFAQLAKIRQANSDEKPTLGGKYVVQREETLMVEWPNEWSFPDLGNFENKLAKPRGKSQKPQSEGKEDGNRETVNADAHASTQTQTRLDF